MIVSPEKHAKTLRTVYKSWRKALEYANAMVTWHEVEANKAHYRKVADVCANQIALGGK